MSFDDRISHRKAETYRPFIVDPRARARHQHGTDVAGRKIRVPGPSDDPPLARTIDKQIRLEDVVGHQVFVERDLEGQGFVPRWPWRAEDSCRAAARHAPGPEGPAIPRRSSAPLHMPPWHRRPDRWRGACPRDPNATRHRELFTPSLGASVAVIPMASRTHGTARSGRLPMWKQRPSCPRITALP